MYDRKQEVWMSVVGLYNFAQANELCTKLQAQGAKTKITHFAYDYYEVSHTAIPKKKRSGK